MSDSIRIHKQIVDMEKLLKGNTHQGISFVRKIGNKTDYVNIQNVPEQDFKYFHNPSKLSANERRRLKTSTSVLIEEPVAIDDEP
jgi:hypothetical protein